MAEVKVRPYLSIRPAPVKGSGMSAYYVATVKGINRMGGVVESMGQHLEQTNKLFAFRNEFLIESNLKRIKLEQKGIKLDQAEEKKQEDKNNKWWRKFLDKKAEEDQKKKTKKPEDQIDKGDSVIKKAISPLKKFLGGFSKLFEAFIRFTVLTAVLDWISGSDDNKLAKFIGNIIKIFSFVRKLTGFGIGAILDGLTNLFGGYDKLKSGNLLGGLQGLLGVGQLLAGVALVKAAQYVMMPWKLIQDVSWITKLFTDMGKATGEMEGAQKNKDIVGYVDKDGNQISKEDFEKAKKSAARNDAKKSKGQGKGWKYSGGEDAVTDRYRAQFKNKDKNFLQRGAQRTRIGFKRATKGVRGQFKAAGNWLQANPGKGNAIFSVVGGLARAGGGLMSGENAGEAVGAGLGQATGGIAGFALGNMLLPGVGGIIGSALGSFLGEWVGTKLGPIIDPIMKPLGSAFKLGFDIIGMGLMPVLNEFGEFFGALVDGLSGIIQLSAWILKTGADVLNFAWQNSAIKKAIDGMIWVWQNKDNIGKAVGEALTRGAQGTLDALTFNIFDFDKQNKKFAGGKVPLMAAGGQLRTDSPEEMGLKAAGSAIVSVVESTLDSFGLVGNFAKMSMASDLNRVKSTFGSSRLMAAAGGQKIAAQITKPTNINQGGNINGQQSSNKKLESIVGTNEVRFLTEQPNKFSPMNDGSMRGLLADIYNGLVSLNVIGGDGTGTGTDGGVNPDGTHAGPSTGPSSYEGTSWNKDPAFAEATNKVAKYFNIRANDLLGLMASESGLRPNADNGKHVGLIQFGASQAKGAGTTQAELKRMSRAEQMPYVQKYLENAKLPKGASAGHLYTAVFLPAFVTKPADFIIANKQGTLPVGYPESRRWYSSNRGLDMNNDGKLTIAELGERIQKKKREFKIPMAKGGFLRFARGGEMTVLEAGPEVDPKTGQHISPRMKKREELGKKRLKAFAGGGQLAKLDFSKQGKPHHQRRRGTCTEGVILTAEKSGANIGAPDVFTSRDPNNPRGLMAQAVGRFGWGSVPGVGKSRAIRSPYGNVSVLSMTYRQWMDAVVDGKIPSGALVFSTERGWDYSGGSSGNDSAIAQAGGTKLWSGYWQYDDNHRGKKVGSVYGPSTKEVVALTHPGGNSAGYDGSIGGADPDSSGSTGSTTNGTGGGKTSLLGGSGEQKDIGTILEEAFKKFKEGFGQGVEETKPAPAPTKPKPKPAGTTASPGSTAPSTTVQKGSEAFTSNNATQTGGAAVAPILVPINQGGAAPKPNIVVNSSAPTAMVSP